MKTILNAGLAIPFALALSAQANAGILFDPVNASSSVSSNLGPSFCFACSIDTTLSDLDSQSATLEVGDSHDFDFFDIEVGGLAGLATFHIDATLGFSAPVANSSNSGSGGFVTAAFLGSAGLLIWEDDYQIFDLGNGTVFGIELESGIAASVDHAVNVGATVTLLSEASVAEPGTMALMLAGVAGLVSARRKA